MCPKRPLSEIKCIFGDGIFDNTLNNGSDLNAFILGDVYHLLDAPNSVWKQVFKSSFALISSFLHTMVNSYIESEFDVAFAAAKEALKGDVELIEDLERIGSQKNTYAKHIVHDLPGNLGRHGSSHAEQNHWSYVARIGPSAVSHLPVAIRDMLERQRQVEVEMANFIFQYYVNTRGKHVTQKNSIRHKKRMLNDIAYAMKHDSLIDLSSWGHELFCEVVDESLFYIVSVTEGGHSIHRVGSEAPPRIDSKGFPCFIRRQP
jgi:hypothetical protein